MKATILSLALFIVLTLADEPVIKEESTELEPNGPEFIIESVNYPEDAPALLQQTWKLSTTEENVIQIDCSDIRLFEESPCGDWVLVVTDGDNKEEICTSIFDYSKVSKTNKVELVMKTGVDARGFVACVAKAVPK